MFVRNPAHLRSPDFQRQRHTAGFTLIELLVVVLVMLILASITVATINITIDGDKVRGAARQVQSYLEGARDRAIFAREARGVRFLLDPNNPRTVTSLIYIAPTPAWSEGKVALERRNSGDDTIYVLRGFDGFSSSTPGDYTDLYQPTPTGWKDLYDRGILKTGNRIQIPSGTGAWYTVNTDLLDSADPSDNNPPVRLILQSEYRQKPATVDTMLRAFDGSKAFVTYKLELTPAPMPNQEPVQLPRGSVVNLDRSSSDPDGLTGGNYKLGNRLPTTWKDGRNPAGHYSGFSYSTYCDIMFSPRGTVTGPEASSGLIHLYVGEQKDADRDAVDWASSVSSPQSAPEMVPGLTPSDSSTPYQRGDKVVVSLFTQTGAISVNPLYVVINAAGTAENATDRFRYSEVGEVAGR